MIAWPSVTVPLTFVVGGIVLAEVEASSEEAVWAAGVAVRVGVAVVPASLEAKVVARIGDSGICDLHGIDRVGQGGGH